MTDLELIYPTGAKRKRKNHKKRVVENMEKKGPKRVSNQTNKKISKHVNKYVEMQTSKHVYVNDFLSKKAFAPGSFRLPPEILEKFDEVYYFAKSRYKTKFKRYAVVVAALALFFWDFEKNGRKSDLFKLLIQQERDK